jgi:hypothetical protein
MTWSDARKLLLESNQPYAIAPPDAPFPENVVKVWDATYTVGIPDSESPEYDLHALGDIPLVSVSLQVDFEAYKKEEDDIEKKQAAEEKKYKEEAQSAPSQDYSTNTPPTSNKYYRNCKAVWADLGHGITSSDPGYSHDLDRDGDGKACEWKPKY